MFEHMTYETIMEQVLKRVESDVDKRQGSIIWDAVAPVCAELAQAYIELDNILRLTYAETSYDKWLDKRCSEMGVHREAATYSIRLGLMYGRNNMPMDIPLGSRFSIETVNYKAIERIETGKYKLVCEQAGIVGNQLFGKLIPVENISGLASAELMDVLIPGENIESDESLFARYEEKVNSTPYGGNIDDYMQKTKAIEGVGDCKIFPVWNGGGTVRVAVIDSEFNTPSDTLIDAVQEILDPIPYSQQGMGLAPIGHWVTVAPVEAVEINLDTTLVLKQGYSIGQMQKFVEDAFNEYLKELSKTWAKEDYLVVRLNQLEARILNIEGLLDIEATTFNGNGTNVVLNHEQIPIMGAVVLNE